MRNVHCSGHQGGCIPACTGQGGVYPSMHWAGGVFPGGCLPREVSALRGCLPGGCLPRGCLPREVSALGELSAGGCLPGGVCPSACSDTPPPPRERNYRHLWKHNLAATTLWTVIIVNDNSKSIPISFERAFSGLSRILGLGVSTLQHTAEVRYILPFLWRSEKFDHVLQYWSMGKYLEA